MRNSGSCRVKFRTVLGEERDAIRTYGDGSVDCPFCCTPQPGPCENPYCDANPSWGVDALLAHQEKRAAEVSWWEADKRIRRVGLESSRNRAAEHEAWRERQLAEASRRGACLRCLFQAGWERVKFIRHRGECPKSRR